MKINKNLKFAALAAVAVLAATLLFQIPITRAVAQDGAHQDDRPQLHLKVNFVHNRPLGAAVGGGLFTWGGTLSHYRGWGIPIGTFGVHFVRTTPATTPSPVGTETLLHGILRFPDGLISFTGLLLPEDSVPDANGVINRIAAITGGTGAYRNARGELNHRTSNGVEQFILDFVGN